MAYERSKNFFIEQDPNLDVRVYVTKSNEDETYEDVLAKWRPGGALQWFTNDKEDRSAILKALNAEFGISP